MPYSDRTTIPCDKSTRRKLKALKRADENWDSLLRKMGDSYNPDEAGATE